MKALVRLSAVLLALSVLGQPAAAQTEDLYFKSGSGVGFSGVQVGTYRGMLLSEPGTPTIDIYCVDFLNEVKVGDTWTARVTNAGGSLANTRLGQLWGQSGISFFGTDDVVTRYRKAAWLTTQFAIQNTSAWGGIHSAIWLLTTPNYATNLPSAFVTAATYWIGEAAKYASSIDLSKFTILTDVNTVNGVNGIQEYMTVTATPEPATITILGTGLAGLYAARRRRRKQSSDA